MADLPDYYAVLEVPPTATEAQIKTAYKKAALKWHPDRVPADSPERGSRTRKFQKINDAYYTLSSEERRKEYDETRKWHSGTSSTFDDDEAEEEIPRRGAGNFFGWGKSQGDQFSEQQFGSVFEEMMNEADLADGADSSKLPNTRVWAVAGGIAGGTLGFIAGNVVGLTAGAAAGASLGSIRDKHKKSVYEVYNALDPSSKAKLLSELASKILAGAIS